MKKGLLTVEEREGYRAPGEDPRIGAGRETITLNESQETALREILKGLSTSRFFPALLFGVTGSGKTLVYMELIEEVLRSGKQAIVLIPEIALTYQTVLRFVRRFGECVSFLHSRLSDGEKYDQFKAARNGRVKIMVGRPRGQV